MHESTRGRDDRTKRAIDLGVSVVALVLLSPILGVVALLILSRDGRPILFRQRRPGRNGVPFTIIKFRTMRPTRPGEVAYHTDDQRVTRLGRLLRATSADELPELWNVLRGEMSLVGPRPLLMEYLPSYTAEQRRRHDVRPGITSWAAVNGRHLLRFEERLALDTWYVDHRSLRLDALILAEDRRPGPASIGCHRHAGRRGRGLSAAAARGNTGPGSGRDGSERASLTDVTSTGYSMSKSPNLTL